MTSVAEPLAWDELIAFGLGVLKLTPTGFWGMTLRELAAVMRGVGGDDAALRRDRLGELMHRFPDRESAST